RTSGQHLGHLCLLPREGIGVDRAGVVDGTGARAGGQAAIMSNVVLTRRSFTRRVVIVMALGASTSWLASAAASALVPHLPEGVPDVERARVVRMAESADVSTRVDAVPFVARLPVFEYLLDHPEFATHITRMLRLARYRIWQTPRGLYLDD